MKLLDERRDADRAKRLLDTIAETVTRSWTLMEVCGGQTHAIVRHSLDTLLPRTLTLVHGPGCPVCVTPLAMLDAARKLALDERVVLCTFGDMTRVPGGDGDLLDARARGGSVRIVSSPLEALSAAERDATRVHVFFAVGFETTAPAVALAIEQAARRGVENFALLVAHVRVPPALERIFADDDARIDGLLAAGHVCAVEGTAEYETLSERYRVPIVVTGFEPVDLLLGVLRCVVQLERGEARVENAYEGVVRPEGNASARAAVGRVFEVVDAPWRGLGVMPRGGLALRPELARFDATRRFGLRSNTIGELEGDGRPNPCRAGLVLQGKLSPRDCPELGRRCTPERPLGAPMVSSEGACAAYFRFRVRADPSGNRS
jgi:hydrogenase expression/formation protein HypD